MSEYKSPIPSMIYNAAVGGHITNSQQIIDENENKEQSQINAEVKQNLGQGGSVDIRINQAKNDIIGSASSNGNTLKKIEDRISPIELAVGTGDNIDTRIETAVTTEKTRAEEIEKNLDRKIYTLETIVGPGDSINSRISDAVAKETTRAQNIESTLQINIDTEIVRAQTAEKQLITLYNNLQQSQPIPVTELPAIGEEGKIYRLTGSTSYSDYMWNNSQFIKMATYNNAIDNEPIIESENLVNSGGVFTAIEAEKNRAKAAEQAIIFDVSVYNNGVVFESISALLGNSNLDTLIPVSFRHSGMTIRFIQGSEQSSDNKYVQYRLMSDTFSTTVADWQGDDDEPMAGSDNLVKSGGVANAVGILVNLKNYKPHTLLFTKNDVSIGETVYLYLRNGEGDIYSVNCGVGFFDENDERIYIAISIESASSVQSKTAYIVIPDNFSYAKILNWGNNNYVLAYKEIESNLPFKNKMEKTIYRIDNINICVRCDISFPNSSSIKLGSGYIYIKKQNRYYIAKNIVSETTYDLSGNKYLCFNSGNDSINIRDTVQENDIILLWHDNVVGFCDGLLYKYYEDSKLIVLNNTVNAIGWEVVSRASISFNGASVTIGDGYMYFLKGKTQINFNHSENTYDIGAKYLVFNISSRTISIKSSTSKFVADDVCLLYYDAVKHFAYGLLYKYWIEEQISQINNEISIIPHIPAFVTTEAKITFNRICQYANVGSYMLGFITDVHSGNNTRYNQVYYLNEVNKIFGFDVLINNGDIGLDVGETTEGARELMYNTKKGMNCSSPWILNKGNHERLVSQNELGQIFNRPSKSQFHSITFGNNTGLYGYLDNQDKNVRMIYLNTSDSDDTSHIAVSEAQINWLVNTLASTPNGYNNIIVSHVCLYPTGYGTYSNEPCIVILKNIILDYVNKRSGSGQEYGYNISWDFTSANGKVVCCLAGHSHFNKAMKYDGVNFIVRSGYPGFTPEDLPDGATNDNFSANTQCNFDVLVVLDNSNAKIFRIGAGGVDRDLAITY